MLPALQWQQQNRGFSLVELLVVLAMSSVIITAIYQTFHSQQRSYQKQNTMAMMQQNLRAATYMMTRELRSAGYDPRRTGNFGIVTTFPAPNNPFTIDYNAQTNIIAFITDEDGDGQGDRLQTELIAYRFNAAARTLERFNIESTATPTGAWETVAEQVDAVNFVYYDENGARTRIPQDIRSIVVSLLIRSEKKELTYTNTDIYLNKENENICPSPQCTPDHYRRQLWTTTVHLRNLPPFS